MLRIALALHCVRCAERRVPSGSLGAHADTDTRSRWKRWGTWHRKGPSQPKKDGQREPPEAPGRAGLFGVGNNPLLGFKGNQEENP